MLMVLKSTPNAVKYFDITSYSYHWVNTVILSLWLINLKPVFSDVFSFNVNIASDFSPALKNP